MWVFINGAGYFSVIEREGHPDQLIVRARDAADLERLKGLYLPTLGTIQHTPRRDYAARATSTKTAFATALGKAVLDIRYFNFKAATATALGRERESIYHGVWRALLPLQR